MSDLSARARTMMQRELELYKTRTVKSKEHTTRASRALPRGVPSSFQAYDPYPIVGARARGSWLEDLDGNHYVDYNMVWVPFPVFLRRLCLVCSVATIPFPSLIP
jgi:glutamate-1-semialdehyde 2,1-aminomutase